MFDSTSTTPTWLLQVQPAFSLCIYSYLPCRQGRESWIYEWDKGCPKVFISPKASVVWWEIPETFLFLLYFFQINFKNPLSDFQRPFITCFIRLHWTCLLDFEKTFTFPLPRTLILFFLNPLITFDRFYFSWSIL